jgi:hypothetical protein
MKIWCQDYRDRVWVDAAMRDVSRFRGLSFCEGERLSDRFPADATVELRTRRSPTDYFSAGVFPFVSAKLRSILEAHQVQAEFLPVVLTRKKGEPIAETWYCFNPLVTSDWFDRTRSVFTPEQRFATKIERVAIDEARCGDEPLVVAENTIPDLIAVRDDLADAILSAGCTGVVFKLAKDWRNPTNPVV